MKGSLAAALNAHLFFKPDSSSITARPEKGMLRTYPKVVHYLLQTYTTDDVIAETDAALTRCIRQSTVSPTQYTEAVVATSLTCGEVNYENVLK